MTAEEDFEMGWPNEALACFDKAIKLKPDYAEALIGRELAKESLFMYREALRDLDKGIALKQNDPEAFYCRAKRERKL